MSSKLIIDGTQIANELNYVERDRSFPSYQYRKLYPANGGNRNLILSTAGVTQNTIFNIPAEQVNMGESYLEYKVTVEGQGATFYAWVFSDVFGEFNSVLYRDTGSQHLVELRDANLYNSVMMRLDTSQNELEYGELMNGLAPSNALTSDAQSKRFDNTTNALNYRDVQSLMVGPVGADTAAPARNPLVGPFVFYRRVYLKTLGGKHSFFGMAKDSLFPQETYLDINLIGNKFGFKGTSNTIPTSGAAALEGNIMIDNLVLNLAVQQNQDLIRDMKARIATGLTMPIPWVRVHTLVGHAGDQATYNLTLDSKQHGQRVQRLIYVPFAGSTINRMYDHRNIDGAHLKISEYQTELDNSKLQRDIIKTSGDGVANVDDYMLHKKLLKNTTYISRNSFNFYWVHIDAFDSNETNADEDGSIYTDGYNLDKPTIWTVNKLDGNADAIHNMAIVLGQKLLTVSSTSFAVV